jgi:peptide deformylase
VSLTKVLRLRLPTLPEGRVLDVVQAPSHMLSVPGSLVDPADPLIAQLAADLVATMRVSPGCVGLAAPQVGVSAQAFCVDVSGHPKTRTSHGLIVLVNAELLDASRSEKGREGCMSVPDLTGDVKRATKITVAGQLPLSGERVLISSMRSITAMACFFLIGLRVPMPSIRARSIAKQARHRASDAVSVITRLSDLAA